MFMHYSMQFIFSLFLGICFCTYPVTYIMSFEYALLLNERLAFNGEHKGCMRYDQSQDIQSTQLYICQ